MNEDIIWVQVGAPDKPTTEEAIKVIKNALKGLKSKHKYFISNLQIHTISKSDLTEALERLTK